MDISDARKQLDEFSDNNNKPQNNYSNDFLYYIEILHEVLTRKFRDNQEVHKAKLLLCRKYGLSSIPGNAMILEFASQISDEFREVVEPYIRLKPMRTISGVAPVAVMTSPASCPHGKCIYCPGGVDFGSPQSYTGHEPAAMRGADHDFDPYLQTKARIEQLTAIGHPTDKIDLIIMGGTFTARDQEYQDWFVKRCFDALNGDGEKNPSALTTAVSNGPRTLEKAHIKNEAAPHRCIGLTIETRADWCREPHVDRILQQGGTRVELGVQTTFDEVLSNVERGHTVEDSILATRILKDSGLKVCYHMMPHLPGSSRDQDIEAFRRIFEDGAFKPDMLKIYPTLVVRGTKLYEMWQRDDYEALTTDNAVRLLAEVNKFIPGWVRIQRIQRDIPANLIEAGVDKSNLRQLVTERLSELNLKCNCIRCREVGHRILKGTCVEPDVEHIKLLVKCYEASEGEEVFMSYEDIKNDLLIGFVRLRKPSAQAHRDEIRNSETALIRELRVVGPMIPVAESSRDKRREWQHRGYGHQLIRECEQLAKDRWDAAKILVTSGAGVRNYYRNLGYKRDGVYMGKSCEGALLIAHV